MSFFKHKIVLILVFGLILCGVVAAGYFFAWVKSEPVYVSKADELMFDEENKSPKYIVVLPEKKMHPRKAALARLAEIESGKPKSKIKKLSQQEELSQLLANILSVTKLESTGEKYRLEILDALSDNYEKTEEGLILPRVAADGSRPWAVYGKNIKLPPNFYKVAVVIKDLGLNPQTTETMTDVVPSEISFSFSPYGQKRDELIRKARAAGHETYVDLLLSSKDFLHSDTGPLAMDITVSEEELINRVRKSLSSTAAVGGMVVNAGMAGEDNLERLKKVLEELRLRGLLIIDATGEDGINSISLPGLARKKADIVLENIYDSEVLFKQLLEAEYIAKNNGQVLIVAESKPIVIQAVNQWIKTFSPKPKAYEDVKNKEFDKPFALVPVSNLVVEE